MSKYIDLESILHVPNIRKVYEYDEVWRGYAQNEHKECIVSAKVVLKGDI